MKHFRPSIFAALRVLTFTAACAVLPAQADEYADVGQLVRTGKFAEALGKTDSFLAGKPNDAQMRFFKGVILRNTGKLPEAITVFTKLTEDYPELPEPYNNLAVLYAGQNQYDKARAALEMAIRTNPSYATAHENLGDVYARLASQAYNKALQLDGANAAVPPKLAIIREVFKPNINGYRPPAATPAAAPPPAPAEPVVVAAAPAAAPVKAPAVAAPAKPAAAASPASAAPQPAANNSDAKDIEAAVHAWAKAWSAQDMTGYLGSYGKEFDPPGKQSRAQWEKERHARIVGKPSISVTLENLKVTVQGTEAVAKFRQGYRGGSLSVSSQKTLEMSRVGNRWLIVKEYTGN